MKQPASDKSSFADVLFPLAELQPGLARLIHDLPGRNSDDATCETLANQLHAAIFDAAMRTHPCITKGGANKARAALEQLRRHLLAADRLLLGIHSEVIEHLDIHARRFGQDVRSFRRDIRSALQIATSADADSKSSITEPARKLEDRYAKEVAGAAAEVFMIATGRKATKIVNWDTKETGGPFVIFLAEVFELANVDASPIYWTDQLSRNRCSSGRG